MPKKGDKHNSSLERIADDLFGHDGYEVIIDSNLKIGSNKHRILPETRYPKKSRRSHNPKLLTLTWPLHMLVMPPNTTPETMDETPPINTIFGAYIMSHVTGRATYSGRTRADASSEVLRDPTLSQHLFIPEGIKAYNKMSRNGISKVKMDLEADRKSDFAESQTRTYGEIGVPPHKIPQDAYVFFGKFNRDERSTAGGHVDDLNQFSGNPLIVTVYAAQALSIEQVNNLEAARIE